MRGIPARKNAILFRINNFQDRMKGFRDRIGGVLERNLIKKIGY